ncbi:MAG: 50S ribosomal protein L15 [Erysipelotrichaceae bacterium]|nr:50S ribosomal protein L15 [Erysipelotrichaceae bacterium]
MNLFELEANPGARKARKRIGRGQGSGNGKTAGKGQKGQLSRSGGGKGPGFEGGQTPIYKRIPKRGFTNINRKVYAVVNLSDLNRFEDGAVVNPETLKAAGLVKKELAGIKVLGSGNLEKKLTVSCHAVSASAKAAIEKAGGTVEVL